MNKKILIILLFIGFLIFFLIAIWIGLILQLGISENNSSETLLDSSVSPNGKYTLEAYKTEPGATVDFSIKVYIIAEKNKKLIYNAYHEYTVKIEWISDSQVSINDKILDLSKSETFDWRN